MKSGVVILHKEEGISSLGAVKRLGRLMGAEKAGHTGTLDPLATGVLPVLIGRAVKASEFMLTKDKHYRATMTLGITTDTEDITGEVLSRSDKIPPLSDVLAAVSRMSGEIMQTPPMYSAIKVGGRKLYDIAREGRVIEREPRKITVYSIFAKRLSDTEYTLDVHCSGGTYIRTLCADIGNILGCGAVMSALCRTEASGYTLDMAHTLAEIEAMSEVEREALIFPTEHIFRLLPEIKLPEFFARLAHSGLEIYLKKISVTAAPGERFRLCDSEGFFALGEVREYEAGLAVKPIRQFR